MESNGRESSHSSCLASRADKECEGCALYHERHSRGGTESPFLPCLDTLTIIIEGNEKSADTKTRVCQGRVEGRTIKRKRGRRS